MSPIEPTARALKAARAYRTTLDKAQRLGADVSDLCRRADDDVKALAWRLRNMRLERLKGVA
jgi:hypothetical protein